MASTNKTSRGLSQFEGNDRLKRDDYNNDMKKIDEELNGLDQNKEPKFTKKGGFNKEKTDSVTTDSSVILATAKAIKTVWDALTSHRNSTTNPHTVTKNQVGLGNVPNYTITDSTTDGSSLKFGSAKAIKTVWTKVLEILGLTNTNKNAILNNTEQIENLSLELQEKTTTGDVSFSNNNFRNKKNYKRQYNLIFTDHGNGVLLYRAIITFSSNGAKTVNEIYKNPKVLSVITNEQDTFAIETINTNFVRENITII